MVLVDNKGHILGDRDDGKMRTFNSGATRDTATDKVDYEGIFSVYVLERYAQYMHKHCKQSDGNQRNADNWQQGIPMLEYMKSKHRHFMRTWQLHRNAINSSVDGAELIESLCAELFNTMGYLHELLKTESIFKGD